MVTAGLEPAIIDPVNKAVTFTFSAKKWFAEVCRRKNTPPKLPFLLH
jgi:hypothetical protein